MSDASPSETDGPPRRRPVRQRAAAWIGGLAVAAAVGWAVPRALDAGSGAFRADKPPLTASVLQTDDQQTDAPLSPVYLNQADPSTAPPVDYWTEEFARWSLAHGAAAGQQQHMRLTLRGSGTRPVVVNEIRAVVDRLDPPAAGWYVFEEGGCGSGQVVREARFDLDAGTARFSDGEVDSAGTEETALTLRVTDEDVEVIDVAATTVEADVRWHLEIAYSGPDGAGTLVVDDGGRPFRVSAVAAGRAVLYSQDPVTSELAEVGPKPDDIPLETCV